MSDLLKVLTLQFSQVWGLWNDETGFPLLNPGRDNAESWGAPERELPASLAKGYDTAQGILIGLSPDCANALLGDLMGMDVFDYVRANKKDRIKRLRQEAEKTIKYTFSSKDSEKRSSVDDVERIVTYGQVAAIIEATLKIKPKALIACGQRRAYALPYGVALQSQLGIPVGLDVAVTMREPANMAELVEMILLENGREGQRAYSPLSILRNACYYMSLTPLVGETKLGRLVGLFDQQDKFGKVTKNLRGQRQRTYLFARLNHNHPKVGLYDRIGVEPVVDDGIVQYVPKTGFVDFRKMQSQSMRFLLGEGTKKGQFPADVRDVLGEESLRPATDDELEKYIQLVMTKGSTRINYTWAEIKKMAGWPAAKEKSANVSELLLALCDKEEPANKKYLADLFSVDK